MLKRVWFKSAIITVWLPQLEILIIWQIRYFFSMIYVKLIIACPENHQLMDDSGNNES